MIEPRYIRRALREALGDETYLRFIVELLGPCQQRGRLRWWQEAAWEPVCVDLGIEPPDFAAMTALFLRCPAHKEDLQPGSMPISYGTRAPMSQHERSATARLAPFAYERDFRPRAGGRETHRAVLFCAGCRAALHAWRASRDGAGPPTP